MATFSLTANKQQSDPPKNLYEKIWESHSVLQSDDFNLLYIDRHLIHEVTSPQAFAGLESKNRKVRRPDLTLGTMDHSISTRSLALDACGPINEKQLKILMLNCEKHGIELYPIGHERQGIVHVIGPELGVVHPGMTVVCGDSHTATQGAFGALAFGIGTSEVEHVFATQTLKQNKAKTMLVEVQGSLQKGVYAKDIILAVIAKIGNAGATGHVIEYAGPAIRAMSMEERMTICNMSIEAGAKAGMIAADEKTFKYLKGRPFAPKNEEWQKAQEKWQYFQSDPDASFDQTITLDADSLAPQVTWGTNPSQVVGINQRIPALNDFSNYEQRQSAEQALHYMQLSPETAIGDIELSDVFIGSCTNGRIEDLRAAAVIASQGKVHKKVKAIVVPGSMQVKKQAEYEGLDKIFLEAGFEWRLPGCSMCLGMNDDTLIKGRRCASTSNRNFEGRQGRGAQTHLVSPAMAAAAAIYGKFVDIRQVFGGIL